MSKKETTIKTEMIFYSNSDCFIVNGHMIHELCEGEFVVYTPEQQKLNMDDAMDEDYPSFRYICNAIDFCLGNITTNILSQEEDFINYSERK
jgi:hypothetical protein